MSSDHTDNFYEVTGGQPPEGIHEHDTEGTPEFRELLQHIDAFRSLIEAEEQNLTALEEESGLGRAEILGIAKENGVAERHDRLIAQIKTIIARMMACVVFANSTTGLANEGAPTMPAEHNEGVVATVKQDAAPASITPELTPKQKAYLDSLEESKKDFERRLHMVKLAGEGVTAIKTFGITSPEFYGIVRTLTKSEGAAEFYFAKNILHDGSQSVAYREGEHDRAQPPAVQFAEVEEGKAARFTGLHSHPDSFLTSTEGRIVLRQMLLPQDAEQSEVVDPLIAEDINRFSEHNIERHKRLYEDGVIPRPSIPPSMIDVQMMLMMPIIAKNSDFTNTQMVADAHGIWTMEIIPNSAAEQSISKLQEIRTWGKDVKASAKQDVDGGTARAQEADMIVSTAEEAALSTKNIPSVVYSAFWNEMRQREVRLISPYTSEAVNRLDAGDRTLLDKEAAERKVKIDEFIRKLSEFGISLTYTLYPPS